MKYLSGLFLLLGVTSIIACSESKEPKDVDISRQSEEAKKEINEVLKTGKNSDILSGFETISVDQLLQTIPNALSKYKVKGAQELYIDKFSMDFLVWELDLKGKSEDEIKATKDLARSCDLKNTNKEIHLGKQSNGDHLVYSYEMTTAGKNSLECNDLITRLNENRHEYANLFSPSFHDTYFQTTKEDFLQNANLGYTAYKKQNVIILEMAGKSDEYDNVEHDTQVVFIDYGNKLVSHFSSKSTINGESQNSTSTTEYSILAPEKYEHLDGKIVSAEEVDLCTKDELADPNIETRQYSDEGCFRDVIDDYKIEL